MSPTVLRKLPAILVVDDEVRSQEALRRTLEEDFEVLCASGADEAMAILEREQMIAGIRIILSGYTDAEDIITGVNEAGIWH